ncbi:MAG: hypothetical protein V1492_02575 [Candidatus Micrarchaeota archaeon]
MFNEIVTNKRMAIVLVLIQILLLLGIFLYQNFLLAIVAIISFVIAAVIWRFGYLIKPMLTKHMHMLEGFGKYEVPSEQDAIVKKEGNRYIATAYMLISFTQSATERTPDQIALMRQSYERALSSLNYVCKISNLVCPINLTPYVEKIKEKRSNAESRLSELSALPTTSNQGSEMARLKREVESYEGQLERVQSGERPMKVVNYAMTSASSTSKDEAIAKVRHQVAELKSVIASTMDTEVTLLFGDDMKRCFEWDMMIPEKEDVEDFLY